MRRLLKTGSYYDVKPWITGGPYAAVYLYGIKGATRNRKKVYVHRLVATHFVGGRKSGNVVHHKVGPANNTKSQLEWVTPSENSKARKYFKDDGTRRKANPKAAKPKVKASVPPPALKGKNAPKPSEKANNPQAEPAPPKIPKPQPKKYEPVKAPPRKVKLKPPLNPPKVGKHLPNDPDEYIDDTETFHKKVEWLYYNWPPFKKTWKQFRKDWPKINRKNFPRHFKQATGKSIADKLGKSPAAWNTTLISAIYELSKRIQTDDPED